MLKKASSSRCGTLGKQEELHLRDVIASLARIASHAQQGQGHEALKCLKHMESEGYLLIG